MTVCCHVCALWNDHSDSKFKSFKFIQMIQQLWMMFDEHRSLYILAPVAILGCLQVTSQKPWRNVIWMFFWPVSFGCKNFFWKWLFTCHPRVFAVEYGCNSPWYKEDWLLNGENRINGGFLMTRQLVPESRMMSDVWHFFSTGMESMWGYSVTETIAASAWFINQNAFGNDISLRVTICRTRQNPKLLSQKHVKFHFVSVLTIFVSNSSLL